jgi:uncharacterized membrane protein HdeD (DUF308 family)
VFTHQHLTERDRAEAHRHWGWILALGILWVVLGIAAIALPPLASLAVTLTIGIVLAVGGIAQIIQAFGTHTWRGLVWHALGGLLALATGLLIMYYPLAGMLTLTAFLGGYFLAEGIIRIIWAFQQRALANWGWTLTSGIVSLALGVLVFVAFPGASLWVIGVLVGVDLIFAGTALVMLALSARGAPDEGSAPAST